MKSAASAKILLTETTMIGFNEESSSVFEDSTYTVRICLDGRFEPLPRRLSLAEL